MRLTWAGAIAFAWFFIALIAFALLRPEYRHATKAISELGVFGAPYMFGWNLFGFILPGVLLMVFAHGYRARLGSDAVGFLALMLTGFCFALAAIPAEMAADGDPDRASTWTRAHSFASMLVAVPWLWAITSIIARFRNSAWRSLAIVSVIAVLGFIAPIVFREYDPRFQAPGLLQRASFLVFFLWYAAAAWLLRNTDHQRRS